MPATKNPGLCDAGGKGIEGFQVKISDGLGEYESS